MLKIVAVAYDRTAALDLAVAFIQSGLKTLVISNFKNKSNYFPEQIDAVIYNTESFFMSQEEEYDCLRRIYETVPENIKLFLKTDSSLRGNLESELSALKDGANEISMVYVPSFVMAKKITRAGIQYLMSEGEDISAWKILGDINNFNEKQLTASVCICPYDIKKYPPGICVLDCENTEEFDTIINHLKESGIRALAGCSCLGARLKDIYGFTIEPIIVDERLEVPLFMDDTAGKLNIKQLVWRAE